VRFDFTEQRGQMRGRVVLSSVGFVRLCYRFIAEGAALQRRDLIKAGLGLAVQLCFLWISESMGNHDSNVVGAGRVC
jgi:hypothetical protein